MQGFGGAGVRRRRGGEVLGAGRAGGGRSGRPTVVPGGWSGGTPRCGGIKGLGVAMTARLRDVSPTALRAASPTAISPVRCSASALGLGPGPLLDLGPCWRASGPALGLGGPGPRPGLRPWASPRPAAWPRPLGLPPYHRAAAPDARYRAAASGTRYRATALAPATAPEPPLSALRPRSRATALSLRHRASAPPSRASGLGPLPRHGLGPCHRAAAHAPLTLPRARRPVTPPRARRPAALPRAQPSPRPQTPATPPRPQPPTSPRSPPPPGPSTGGPRPGRRGLR